jgi:nucleoside-diphosphate-sugar epimerase
MKRRKVLVLGVTGLVGFAAAKRFALDPLWDVVGAARRTPRQLEGVQHLTVDLQDRDGAAGVLGELSDVTHVVYAALFEKPGVVAGWRERDQMETNLAMLRNTLDPLLQVAPIEHVTLLQGTKAYGAHVETMAIPGKERNPRHPHENFYWLQEDELVERRSNDEFATTILRPVVIFGEAVGANLNPVPPLGVYAAVLKAAGEPLHYPGGRGFITEAIDVDMLADVMHWAAGAPAAANQTFNVTNGDVFSMRNVWPVIADAFGMEPGEDRPMRTETELPSRADEWEAVHDRFSLSSPRDVLDFVGQSFVYLDLLACYGVSHQISPTLVSTIKLRQAGFGACMDTEDMLVKWIRHHQRLGYFPPRHW